MDFVGKMSSTASSAVERSIGKAPGVAAGYVMSDRGRIKELKVELKKGEKREEKLATANIRLSTSKNVVLRWGGKVVKALVDATKKMEPDLTESEILCKVLVDAGIDWRGAQLRKGDVACIESWCRLEDGTDITKEVEIAVVQSVAFAAGVAGGQVAAAPAGLGYAIGVRRAVVNNTVAEGVSSDEDEGASGGTTGGKTSGEDTETESDGGDSNSRASKKPRLGPVWDQLEVAEMGGESRKNNGGVE